MDDESRQTCEFVSDSFDSLNDTESNIFSCSVTLILRNSEKQPVRGVLVIEIPAPLDITSDALVAVQIAKIVKGAMKMNQISFAVDGLRDVFAPYLCE